MWNTHILCSMLPDVGSAVFYVLTLANRAIEGRKTGAPDLNLKIEVTEHIFFFINYLQLRVCSLCISVIDFD